MLSEPARTDYDFEFEVLGFRVRVSVGFWIMAVILGYGASNGLDAAFGGGRGMFLAIWIAVLFGSILLHELGHSLAYRKFGIHSSIVLYHFGGLAIPSGSFRGFGSGGLTPARKMFVSFAGPGIQLVLAICVVLFAKANNYALPWFVSWIPGLEGGNQIESGGLYAFVDFMLFANVFWAVLNLIPIWPLDGGQIMRELVLLFGGGTYHSSVISIATCLVAAVGAIKTGHGSIFTFLFLASFAYTNYQIMNNDFGRRW